MGYDGYFHLVDFSRAESNIRRWDERFRTLADELDDPPDWLGYKIDEFERAVNWLDSLEEPPAVNDSFWDAMLYLTTSVMHRTTADQANFWIWGSGSPTYVHSEIPEFLGERSERAAELWQQLVDGNGRTEVEFDRGTYRFQRAGLLSPEEVSELQSELRPLLSETHVLYPSSHDQKSAPKNRVRLVEIVHGLCLIAGRRCLVYNYTH